MFQNNGCGSFSGFASDSRTAIFGSNTMTYLFDTDE
jgi:hypothetical protein